LIASIARDWACWGRASWRTSGAVSVRCAHVEARDTSKPTLDRREDLSYVRWRVYTSVMSEIGSRIINDRGVGA